MAGNRKTVMSESSCAIRVHRGEREETSYSVWPSLRNGRGIGRSGVGLVWLPAEDSNLVERFQRPVCCRYTSGEYGRADGVIGGKDRGTRLIHHRSRTRWHVHGRVRVALTRPKLPSSEGGCCAAGRSQGRTKRVARPSFSSSDAIARIGGAALTAQSWDARNRTGVYPYRPSASPNGRGEYISGLACVRRPRDGYLPLTCVRPNNPVLHPTACANHGVRRRVTRLMRDSNPRDGISVYRLSRAVP